ncbi:hypothetical protein CMESO_33 (nucleomorph) [Chroomonas mesostigmatica CCMP1168]|uniref:Uncharacterized protein n=1 Tax=Chroomonas mesostigmatica CCMP1168 TaxID=1195612 RepID=J7G581_9CRYP|nr:hypothetical protein CMESO_33 [Chroomonas mesostigmatica CCMP1168]
MTRKIRLYPNKEKSEYITKASGISNFFFFEKIFKKNKIKKNFYLTKEKKKKVKCYVRLNKKIVLEKINFSNIFFYSFLIYYFHLFSQFDGEKKFHKTKAHDFFSAIVIPLDTDEKISKNKNLICINFNIRKELSDFSNSLKVGRNQLSKFFFFENKKKKFIKFSIFFIFYFLENLDYNYYKKKKAFLGRPKKEYKAYLFFILFYFSEFSGKFKKKNIYFLNKLLFFMKVFFLKKIFKRKKYYNWFHQKKTIFFLKEEKVFSIFYRKTINKYLKKKKNNKNTSLIKSLSFKKIFISGSFFFFFKRLAQINRVLFKKKNLPFKKKLYLFLQMDHVFALCQMKKNILAPIQQFDFRAVYFLTFKNKKNVSLNQKKRFYNFDVCFQKKLIFFIQEYFSSANQIIEIFLWKLFNKKKNFLLIIDFFFITPTKLKMISFIIFGNFFKKFFEIGKYFGLLEFWINYQINNKLIFGIFLILKKNLFYLLNWYFFIRKKKSIHLIKKIISANF